VLQAQRTGRVTRFGPFELDRSTGELRKHGIKVRLQGKPFQILIALLDRAGETVSREDLRQCLWSDDTFVDFESGLNTAANRLRIALGDSADNPRYIETLARSGYRFIAPVEELGPPLVIEPEISPAPVPVPPKLPHHSHLTARRWLVALLAMAAIGTGLVAGRILWASHRSPDVQLQQITFRRGGVSSARFAPDGSVVYAAKWMNTQKQIFLANSLSPESRPLGFVKSTLAAVSKSGELALIQSNPEKTDGPVVLARVPMNGGSPLQLATSVSYADWSPEGTQLAIIRHTETQDTLEYPIGKALYQSWGILSGARVSPQGDSIAFFEHPYRGDDGGHLKMVDLQGHSTNVAPGWASAGGLAWAPSGREIYLTATRQGSARKLYAVTREGNLRDVAKIPGTLVLHDIAHDGRVLVSRENTNLVMEGWSADTKGTRDLSWFDWSNVVACSNDCDLVLFDESGEGGGPLYSTYLHRISTGETTRIAPGRAMALAPDGNTVITMSNANHNQLQLVPVGGGQQKVINGHDIEYQSVQYLPDGQGIVAIGKERDKPLRLYVQDLKGGSPKPLPVDVQPFWIAVSPDGKSIAGRSRDGKLVIQALSGGAPRVLETEKPLLPIRWTTDGRRLFGFRIGSGVSNEVVTVDVATGTSELILEIKPSEPEATVKLHRVVMSEDGKRIVYSYHRSLSELYIVSGW